MTERPTDQAKRHDWLIEETIKLHYKGKIDAEIAKNPNGEHNKNVGEFYPDIIIYRGNEILIIEEIETEDSVNENEFKTQWEHYSKLGAKKFILTVPKEKIHDAIILTKNLSCELWYYEIKDEKLIFNKYR